MENSAKIQDQTGQPDGWPVDAADRGTDARVRTARLPVGVKPLILDGKTLTWLGETLLGRHRIFDDNMGGPDGLLRSAVSPTSVILEIGDRAGLIFIENLYPNSFATVHIIALDRAAIKDFLGLLSKSIEWTFSVFRPAAISAWIPVSNVLAIRLADRLTFRFDGIIRQLASRDGVREDVAVYTLLLGEFDGFQES